MKKLMLCAAALIAAGLLGWLPMDQKDVGDLLPVLTLVAARDGDNLTLDGGEDLKGQGADWPAAMANLRETAPGEAFFGATGQIVLVGEAETDLPAVLEDKALRPAARIYLGDGEIEAEGAGKYLEAREGGVTVQQLQSAALTGKKIAPPTLRGEDGRYSIDKG